MLTFNFEPFFIFLPMMPPSREACSHLSCDTLVSAAEGTKEETYIPWHHESFASQVLCIRANLVFHWVSPTCFQLRNAQAVVLGSWAYRHSYGSPTVAGVEDAPKRATFSSFRDDGRYKAGYLCRIRLSWQSLALCIRHCSLFYWDVFGSSGGFSSLPHNQLELCFSLEDIRCLNGKFHEKTGCIASRRGL